jgi:hypothetical protein
MKTLLLFLLCPYLLCSQVQIGNDIDGEAAGDRSGYSVSLSSDGSIVAIGAPQTNNNSDSGYVRIYENQSGTWVQIGTDINGYAVGDRLGESVSLSSDGSMVAIGAPQTNESDSGYVRIYENISGTWVQIGQDIEGEAADDGLGYSVSLSSNGSTVAIGARFNDGNGSDSGHVRVYENQSDSWVQIGVDIDGKAAEDNSGFSLSLSSDGSVVAIGAPFNSGNGTYSGYVQVYENQSGTWVQIGQDIDSEAAIDRSGWSVSLSSDGSVIAIGAPYNDENGTDAGHVRVYKNQSDTWVQLGQDIDGSAAGDLYGNSVSLSSDGSIVAIGGPLNDINGSGSGHVRIYQNISDVWTQIGTDINGEAAGDLSGWSVSLSSDGSVVAIGARQNDGNGSNSGYVRVYDLSAVLSTDSFNIELSRVYPNPATTEIQITLKNNLQLLKVNVYNQLGQFIKESKTNIVNVSDLSKGMYLVEIETNQGKGIKKVLIE